MSPWLESLKTRTTRYRAYDKQERAVLLWSDYQRLLAAAACPTPRLFPLFQHMAENHDLYLLDSELEEILAVALALDAHDKTQPHCPT